MLQTRVIPCLLLKNGGLYKTVQFKKPTYIGDPRNAIKIFNEKEVDELVFLDYNATVEKKNPDINLLKEIVDECFMPLGFGGGIHSMQQINEIFKLGVEKIIINSAAIENPKLISQAAAQYGSQSIVVAIDVKKNFLGKYEVWTHSGTINTKHNPVTHAQKMVQAGAGELFINSIDRDGTMKGYDLKLISQLSKAVSVPIVAAGGAGTIQDFSEAVHTGGASAVAAGSFFVFQGPHRAVLISYPTNQLRNL